MNLYISKKSKGKDGFTFAEVLITLSLFLILASIGVGAYFRYYSFSLINNDLTEIRSMLNETRFKAMKNPYNSDYGLHLDTANDVITAFRDTYIPGDPGNTDFQLEQLGISNTDLQPDPGFTDEILFQNATGKTQNSGSFTVSNTDFSFDFTINAQGAFE